MPVLILLVILLAVGLFWLSYRIPRLSRREGAWGFAATDDPRIAVAAMMYALARHDGPVTQQEEALMMGLLRARIGLDPDAAELCFSGGRRLARSLRGDLNARLHQLIGPIERKCNAKEREDVVDMLHQVAGRSAERIGAVRDSLGRVSSSLLQD